MRVLISMAASLMLLLALVGPVAATGPGCSDFGAATVAGAHREMPGYVGHPFGHVVSSINHGGFAPLFDSVREVVQFEHELYCAK